MISAEIILDSISEQGHRLTTFALRYPRFIHSEFMTHRQFSRNASSSRAVPTKKLIEEVRSRGLRVVPVFWGKNQKGMQAVEELPNANQHWAIEEWEDAARSAADHAETLLSIGVHKQIVNRILEPFLHINVVCTSTDYMNFFGLRLDAGAQPEMRALAVAMWKAYKASTPKLLKPGEWHLPFITGEEAAEHKNPDTKALISAARVARVSYKSFTTGKLSKLDEDIGLSRRLLSEKHLSPFEHQAMPDTYDALDGTWWYKSLWANFTGWWQYRKGITGESCAPLPPGVDTL